MITIAPRGGARPNAGPKPRAGAISKPHQIRFTDEEWELITELAKKENLTTSEYIRKKALGEMIEDEHTQSP